LSDLDDKACVSLISFVELFSCLFTPGLSPTPKAQPTLSTVATSKHRSTPDRRISAPIAIIQWRYWLVVNEGRQDWGETFAQFGTMLPRGTRAS
jgi:hypothetical protein